MNTGRISISVTFYAIDRNYLKWMKWFFNIEVMKSYIKPVLIAWLLFSATRLLAGGTEDRESGERGPWGLGSGEHGLILGFNSSIFIRSGSSPETCKYIPGITLGFYQAVVITPRFSIEPEFLFTTKGSRIQTVGNLYLHQVFTYLEIPVLAKWIINPQKKVQMFLAGGSFFDLKLIAFNEVGFPEEISQVDVGAALGVGIKFHRVSFKISVKQGFLDIDRSEATGNYKNRTFSIIAGLSF